MSDVLLSVKGLQVHFPIRRGLVFDRTVGHVRAVDGVDLEVERGQTYGLVGESGCGKSTLGRAILRLEEPTGGTVDLRRPGPRRAQGRGAAALSGGGCRWCSRIPLASLNPRQSVESLLTEPLTVHGLSEADREEFGADSGKSHLAKVSSMLEVVGLPRATLAKYPHEFSGGQRQRIGIARAMILNPDLVIADEPVSALDVSVQAQVINLLEHLQDMLGLTYIVIAHDLAVVRHISDTIGVMYLGRMVEQAPSDDLYASPLHPYTIALDVGHPDPRSGGRGPPRADPAQGRPAQPGQPAVGLPLPHPLPVPAAHPVRHRGAAAAADRGPARRVAGWPATTSSRS